jgi:hypothetical protein
VIDIAVRTHSLDGARFVRVEDSRMATE